MKSVKKIFLLLIIIESVILFLGINNIFKNNMQYSFDLDNMLLVDDKGEVENLNYIDKSYGTTNRYLKTDMVSLPKGKYKVYIEYQSDWNEFTEDKHDGIWFEFVSTAGRVRSGYETLLGGDNNDSIELFVYSNATGYVKVGISDELDSYILIRNIKCKYEFKDNIKIFISSYMFLFFLIDTILFAFIFKKKEVVTFVHNSYGYIIGFGVLFLISCIPVLQEGIPWGHDIYFHLMRIEGLAEGIKGGQLPVKIHPLWMENYGYAVGVFYGDAFLYPAAFTRLLGYSLEFSYKFLVCFLNVIAIFNTFIMVKFYIKKYKWSEVVLAVGVYHLSIYRVFDIYTRAALGEAIAMAFAPILLMGLSKLYQSDKNAWIYISVGATGLLQSHIVSCLMAAEIFLVYFFLSIKKINISVIKQMLISAIVILLVNIGFVLPFIDYYLHLDIKGKNNGSSLYVNAVPLLRLIMPTYNPIGKGTNGNMPINIGISGAIILIVAVVMCVKSREIKVIRYTLLSFIMLYLTTVYMPYEYIEKHLSSFYHMIMNIQFPWRYLACFNIFITILYSTLKRHINYKGGRVIWYLAGILCIFQALLFVMKFNALSPRFYPESTIMKYHVSMQEYLLEGTDMQDSADKNIIFNDNLLDCYVIENKGLNEILYAVNSSENEISIDLPRFYYPGYCAYFDECKTMAEIGSNNRVRIKIPSHYDGNIRLIFEKPTAWKISEFISSVAVIGIFIYCCACKFRVFVRRGL